MNSPSWPLTGEIHLYGLVLPQATAELARLAGLLSASETARAGVLKNARARSSYVAGRGLLREILGAYLGVAAKQLPLAVGGHGKPFLPEHKHQLGFSLAHTGETMLLAVAANREVGIDIELITAGKPLQAMASLVFSPQEQAQLAGLGSPQLEAAFYRCWVRKEACLKACGRGFSLPGASFDLVPLDENPAVMIACCQQQSWQVLDLDVPTRYCAALAVESSCPDQAPPTVVWAAHRLSFN